MGRCQRLFQFRQGFFMSSVAVRLCEYQNVVRYWGLNSIARLNDFLNRPNPNQKMSARPSTI
jgi:hypothetical protein